MTAAPAPLVPADLDLRDFRWMKLDLIALFNSDFNATPDDTAWRAGVTLWGKAWHQVPAGSLPDDDGRLCNLAGLGRDLKTWRRIREQALHGFVTCSDGRLYHRFLCQMAVEAAAERDRFSKRKAADRERKSAITSTGIPPEKRNGAAQIPPENPNIPPEFHRKIPLEGQGEGDKKEEERASAPPTAMWFEGQTLRLNRRDFEAWEQRFADAYPDLWDELWRIDGKLAVEGLPAGKAFLKAEGWLNAGLTRWRKQRAPPDAERTKSEATH